MGKSLFHFNYDEEWVQWIRQAEFCSWREELFKNDKPETKTETKTETNPKKSFPSSVHGMTLRPRKK